ncbi:SdpI family protein [Burkholderia gladioli pv. gladioli]|uniref:SdpI/YhfL family protein n=1 Tax=Burkholderia gladioli TaxID=28095 RepID=A0A095G0T1_BURGA|nr:SdpI family protein [Burkholderia gladioli]AJW99843.1 sdpI/YhfL family protein [Burkholderia gladioli]ASD80004.1 hypothetical protein CEJ98_14120 [Burkholderia gladioli pv. gladioli]AWY54749.1 hypothetical protein A8H28_27005 [Burkholderia gladioli pv. gladioli]KGC11002.1 sdpI/YhfL family protein [Burkholderia gladioli]MDJ1164268.1 SdpI family protein [Burkholderia gladioli pv. gladioli]
MSRLPDAALYLLVSALFFLIAMPLAAGWIKPNRLYGVRTKTTLSNVTTWYRCNRLFGIALMLTSASYVGAVGYCYLHDIAVARVVLLIAFVMEVVVPACLCLLVLKNSINH